MFFFQGLFGSVLTFLGLSWLPKFLSSEPIHSPISKFNRIRVNLTHASVSLVQLLPPLSSTYDLLNSMIVLNPSEKAGAYSLLSSRVTFIESAQK